MEVHRDGAMPCLNAFHSGILQSKTKCAIESPVAHVSFKAIHFEQSFTPHRSVVAAEVRSGWRHRIHEDRKTRRTIEAKRTTAWMPAATAKPCEVRKTP